jgi:hypothetical protein
MTQSSQVSPSKSSSRRALLAGALGGLGAWAGSAIGRVSQVRAEGEAMVVGGDYNDATSATILGNQTNTATVFLAQSTAGGIGVYGYSNSNVGTKGESPSSIGVYGLSTSSIGVSGVSSSNYGVRGTSSTGLGVYGVSTSSTGVAGASTDGFGIIGVGNSVSAAGVKGVSSAGLGVWGTSSSGTAVRGESLGGTGIYGYTQSADNAAVRTRNVGDGTGVIGVSGDVEPVAPTHTGVYGYAIQDNTAKGVWGETTSGHAVHGTATSGFAGYFTGKVYVSKFQEMPEISTPAAPAANKARLFVRDNGSGRTQLCVRFHNGVVRVLATA